MSFPTGLFIDSPELHDASMSALSQVAEEWPEELVQKFKERVPAAAEMSIMVKFMKKDEENGTATGSLLVSDSKKQAIVPVIIKDFSLYPIDVFMAGSKLLPLTPDYFKAYFSNNDVFQKIEEYPSYGGLGRFEDSNLWHAVYPPSLGRYAYASAGYDILDKISATIDPKEFVAKLAADHATAARFARSPHAELIKKLAAIKAVNMNEFRQGADKLIPRNIMMVHKDGDNKYNVLSNADSTFSPSVTTVGRDDMYNLVSKIQACPEDLVNDVDQNGERMLAVPTAIENDEVYIEQPISEKVQFAAEYGNYVVKKRNGVEVEGVVIPLVINFDMEKVPVKLFLGKTMSTMQTEIAGVRMDNSKWRPEASEPRTGQTGVFMYSHGPGKTLCTVPVTIRTMVSEGGYAVKMKVVDLQGVTHVVRKTDMELQRIARRDSEEGTVFDLPKAFKWVPMQGFEEISSNPFDYAAKTAGMRKTAQPVKVIATGFGQYAMKGVDKYAHAAGWDPSNLHGYQAKFILASLGASQEKIASVVKVASRSGQAVVHGLKFKPLTSEKIAAAVPTATRMVAQVGALKSDLTKAASYIENSQTVDALLALNFISPENVSRFVAKIPSFKSAISNLASCLIASRLGIKEIPEQAVSSAMTRMIDVVNGLEALRATQEG